MNNWIKQSLDYELKELMANLKLIALKQKEEEWKRDHYRYTFTVSAQRIFRLLNSSISSESIAPIAESTKKEMIVLRDMLDQMIRESPLRSETG